MNPKPLLRRHIARRRRRLSAAFVEAAGRRIREHLALLPPFRRAHTIALYLALPGEVNLDPLFSYCRSRGRRTCVPVFDPERRTYHFAEIFPSSPLRRGNYGIREPAGTRIVPVEEIDLVVVPAVAFDPAGNRLGRGGGYYDRLLENFSGTAVGVAFGFQLLSAVPVDLHDRPVDFIVTERRILRRGQRLPAPGRAGNAGKTAGGPTRA